MAGTVRVDKFLWAIRAFKTRTDATDACKGGKVKIGEANAKPSKFVQSGDILQVRKGSVTFTYKVLQPLERRVGAKLVPEFAENLTPASEIEKLRTPVETFFVKRDRGAGRPTKKDRREIEEIWDAIDFNDIPDDVAARFGLSEEDLEG
ncbi:MAG: RNA-binding S4 domain-containing protein [Bacteroidales bacterium]|nr:RNA-binding S4 domain-containing protein [Bacteroidales bacterium]MBR6933679.1 RNA-binding S4 domain-containing protein [Bacteroidales bacterium]